MTTCPKKQLTLTRLVENKKHKQVWADLGKLGIERVDEKLKTILEILNQAGFHTMYSCQEEGTIKDTYIMFMRTAYVEKLFQRCYEHVEKTKTIENLWFFLQGHNINNRFKELVSEEFIEGAKTVRWIIGPRTTRPRQLYRQDKHSKVNVKLCATLRFDSQYLELFERLLVKEIAPPTEFIV